MRQIVLDTETTGLDPRQGHRIIEIACLELVNRRLTGRHLHKYLNPDREIDEGAAAVHGITLDFLADKPRFADVADEFLEFVSGAELVIHNAPFDIGFLDAELDLLGRVPVQTVCSGVRDTLRMAREL
ncbi:MAG TPA: DNA polymerase III subunit epsilon, partial [Rhodocyclaceae bacterium]|nr:DNA polymerase III subunit epsilon [Rhodocyclaceae bacterium]